MIVPDEQLAPSGSVGRGASQQHRSNSSTLQQSGGPHHLGSSGNFSPGNASNHYEPQEYTETDFLLPNKLYGSSRFNRSLRANSAAGSDAPAETVCSILLQILVPFLLAGLGTVSAGMLLDVVQNWDVFQEVTELLILVPAVLGMKGNLEMTLASRLSTAVKIMHKLTHSQTNTSRTSHTLVQHDAQIGCLNNVSQITQSNNNNKTK